MCHKGNKRCLAPFVTFLEFYYFYLVFDGENDDREKERKRKEQRE